MANPETKPNSTPRAPSKERHLANLISIFLDISQAFEGVWRILFIAVCVVFVYLSYKVYLYRTLDHYNDKYYAPKGNFKQFIFWGLLCSIFYLITDHYWHKIADPWVLNNFLTLKRYDDLESRKKRSYTIAKWGYFVFYYLGTSIGGYLLIKDTQYFPEFLGGKGSLFQLEEHRALKSATYGMEIYYFIEFGKHVGRFFAHVFLRPEGSYYEYCLHHALSVYLITFSYLINFWYAGIFVLIIHDYTDFGLILGRAYKDYRHRNQILLQIVYVHAVGGWILLRVILFSYSLVYASIYCLINYLSSYHPEIEKDLSHCYMFLIFMLSCLQFMHLYWTYFVFTSAIEVHSNEKLKTHNYD